MALLTREQLEERLAALHRASLELVRDLSLDAVLERIVYLAQEQADAAYAALGVVDDNGNLVRFIPVGMTPDEIKRMDHPPVGEGQIGALAIERRAIRVPDIQADSRSRGFPPGHPDMTSFLGVPILLGDKLLGQIYLTNKETYAEFTKSDEIVIETLAAYAATAITNAGDSRLFITLQSGQVVIWDGVQLLATPFLDHAGEHLEQRGVTHLARLEDLLGRTRTLEQPLLTLVEVEHRVDAVLGEQLDRGARQLRVAG